MTKDKWVDASDNWNTPSDWSTGLPDASSDVVIKYGEPVVTASIGIVNSISIRDLASLDFIDAGSSSVAEGVTNSGSLNLDTNSGGGGSSLTIGGTLRNSVELEIGPLDGTLSAASTVEAGHLQNFISTTYRTTYGKIDLFGSATAEATLDVVSGAGFGGAGVLYGGVGLSGDALVEFKSGQITTIAADTGSAGPAGLTLNGSHAFVADASNTSSNSTLKGLDTVAGYLDLENGAAVRTSGGLTVAFSGAVGLDGAAGDGGSLLKINGTLTNSGTIDIGGQYNDPSATSLLDGVSVVNDNLINLFGDKDKAANVNGTLHTSGAFTNDGSVGLIDDTDTIAGAVSGTGDFALYRSTLEFGSSVSSGETVTFAGTRVDHLSLDTPSAFNGTIKDFFTAGDSVIAKTFAEAQTTLTYTQTGLDSCSWTLTDSTHTAVLNFAGEPYAESDFSISASSNGNVLIKFV
jgi:hypothetical protein